ncbi:hypothetical protein WAI453_007428 [Rhynchosporium graminicola]
MCGHPVASVRLLRNKRFISWACPKHVAVNSCIRPWRRRLGKKKGGIAHVEPQTDSIKHRFPHKKLPCSGSIG